MTIFASTLDNYYDTENGKTIHLLVIVSTKLNLLQHLTSLMS